MKNILIAIPLLFSVSSFAQQFVDMKMGAEFKTEDREVPVELLAHDETGYYFLYAEGKFGQGAASIVKFKQDLTPAGEKVNLIEEPLTEKLESRGFFQIDNTLYHLTTSDTEQTRYIYVQSIQLNPFSTGNQHMVAAITRREDVDLNSMHISHLVSEDKSEIILVFTMPARVGMQKELRIKKLNKNLEKISEETYWIPYPSMQLKLSQLRIHKNNQVLLFATHYFRENIATASNRMEYEHLLFKLEDGRPETLLKFGNENRHLRQIRIKLLDEDTIVFTGFFSEKDKYAVKGTYFRKSNIKTGEAGKARFEYLPKDYFSQLMLNPEKDETDRRFDKGKLEEKNLVLLAAKERHNGEFTLIGEVFYIYSANYTTNFYSGDISVIQLGQDGSLQWARKIGKNNSFPGMPFYTGFILADNYPSAMCFIYNDNVGNEFHSRGYVKAAFPLFGDKDGEVLTCAAMAPDGTYKRQLLGNAASMQGFRMRSDLFSYLSDSKVLVFAQHPANVKRQRLIIFEVQKAETF